MRSRLFVFLLIIVLFSNTFFSSFRTEAQTDDSTEALKLKDYVKSTFFRLQDAERMGANVTLPAQELDMALQLIDQAEGNSSDSSLLSQASSIIENVNSSIPSLIKEGESRTLSTNVSLVSTIAFIAVTCAFVYLYLPRILWSSWAKYRANWRVRPS
ncbi:MAG: hypothetical protein ABSB40_02185 [Nitrososphaeria archaeon]|jgi:hypothetical protein